MRKIANISGYTSRDRIDLSRLRGQSKTQIKIFGNQSTQRINVFRAGFASGSVGGW